MYSIAIFIISSVVEIHIKFFAVFFLSRKKKTTVQTLVTKNRIHVDKIRNCLIPIAILDLLYGE